MNLQTSFSPVIPIAYLATASLAFYLLLNLPQRIRNVCFPILIVPAWRAFATFEYFTWPDSLDGIWGLAVMIWVAHIISLLYVDQIPSQSKSRKQWDMKAAYKLLFDVRHLSDGPETSLPAVSTSKSTLIAFVAYRLLKLIAYWLLTVHLFTPLIPLVFGPVEPWEFDQYAQTYLRRLPFFEAIEPVTLRETCIRVVFTFRWIWLSFVDIDAAHTFLSIMFVGLLQLDSPAEWPPMFGSPSKAFTIRRYWGRFWHRLVHKPYLSLAKIVAGRLCVPSLGHSAEKVFLAFLIFLISGLAHAMVSLQRGKLVEAVDDVAFYCVNFFVMATEGCVLGSAGPMRGLLPQWCWKIIGYVWVFTFWFWVAPKWSYSEVHGEMLKEIERQNRALGLGLFTGLLGGE
ncbi:hypothetical protein M438DRAFT_383288 [Aureobasidium pullulans EXF-150]|uniref:Wax synthase domain-containing protein n=1 Tax=Aureobasidium pullulans EXF-150 TaxID=1043002 RepID=A0A074X8L8_AURPU|nr:uncharacterized protein M438DRAFT_383288 [Aureobasidium pullulans EXF-150]KEQ81860.1 hypothetical protein M438DRAFT_383288 [Aureobasidium pullulans EXF-150]